MIKYLFTKNKILLTIGVGVLALIFHSLLTAQSDIAIEHLDGKWQVTTIAKNNNPVEIKAQILVSFNAEDKEGEINATLPQLELPTFGITYELSNSNTNIKIIPKSNPILNVLAPSLKSTDVQYFVKPTQFHILTLNISTFRIQTSVMDPSTKKNIEIIIELQKV
jgi:hypothetical protein